MQRENSASLNSVTPNNETLNSARSEKGEHETVNIMPY